MTAAVCVDMLREEVLCWRAELEDQERFGEELRLNKRSLIGFSDHDMWLHALSSLPNLFILSFVENRCHPKTPGVSRIQVHDEPRRQGLGQLSALSSAFQAFV